MGGSTRTDADDQERWCNGGRCLELDHAHNSRDDYVQTGCGTSGLTKRVSDHQMISIGGELSFGAGDIGISLFKAEANRWWGDYCESYFPPCGTWDIDFKHASDRMHAFKRR